MRYLQPYEIMIPYHQEEDLSLRHYLTSYRANDGSTHDEDNSRMNENRLAFQRNDSTNQVQRGHSSDESFHRVGH